MNDYNTLLIRMYDNQHDTLGMLYFKDMQQNVRYVFTLEDEFRTVKVNKETRIPAGKYELRTRKEGGFYERYYNHKNQAIQRLTRKYGVIHITNVPNFKYVLIHIGNDEEDTSGCVLIGNKADNNSNKEGWIAESTNAYIIFASMLFSAMEKGSKAFISIIDQDRNVINQFMNTGTIIV
jgi:hypothetical protein